MIYSRRFSRPRFPHLSFLAKALYLLATAGLTPLSFAIENGATAFPNGGEDFLVAAMPPPGLYGFIHYSAYRADFLADDHGDMPVRAFNLKVNALTPRLDWVKPVSIFGADRWGTLVVLPLLDLDLAVSPVPGVSLHEANRGPGDLTIGNGLHWTLPHVEMVNAFDVSIPVGNYDSTRLINPGLNRWVFRLNHIGTWRPTEAWEVSYRLHTDFASRNSATDYESGQTVYLNWAVGWHLQPQTTIGLAGYSLRQVSDDRQAGRSAGADGNRVELDGFGPCVKHFLPNHVMLTAKYFHEFNARNHPKGEQLWLYAVVPLGPGPK